MSIRIMTKVWGLEMKPTEKLIMLSLADNANDEGICYPSQLNIAKKTNIGRTTIIKTLKSLEEKILIYSVKRQRKNGSATSKKYLLFPLESYELLEENEKDLFANYRGQSSDIEHHPQSSDIEPTKGGQSSDIEHLEPSLSIFNHHLYKKLDKNEKDLFIEYWKLRTTMKVKTTYSIKNRLLNQYFNYGRHISILENAINSNWKTFYEPTNINSSTKTERYTKFLEYIKSKVKNKSKVKSDEQGLLSFKEICKQENSKSLLNILASSYLAHIEDKKDFAVRITTYLQDWELHIEENIKQKEDWSVSI